MSAIDQRFPLNDETTIPAVGLGTYLIEDDQVAEVVKTAIGIGYRHVDTAAGYGNEVGVGNGVRAALDAFGLERSDIFVTTKFWPGNPAWGDDLKSKDQTIEECNASLKRLGLDYVDLYLIHAPFGGPNRLDQWRALLDLKQAGKARSIGVSNFTIDHLEEIEAAGLPAPEANQIELHPWSQKPELVAYMRARGIAPIAYSSLVPLSTWREERNEASAKTDDMKADGKIFAAMAERYGVSEAQLLLRWGVQNGFAIIPKSLNPERLRNNLELDGFEIDGADMNKMATMDRGDGVAWASGDPSLTD